MFEEAYEKLGMTERESFARIVNLLLARTFLTAENYNFQEERRITSRDYLFVERNFELFSAYFTYSGFRLTRDSNYGVIYLSSSYDFNRERFDKLTTLMIYTLRLIYEEEREKLSLSKDVFSSTGDLVEKMLALGAIGKKPTILQLHDSLARIGRFALIEKMSGNWEEPMTRFVILPTILFIVSNEQISNMHRLVDKEGDTLEGEDEDIQTAAADSLV